eukprot:6217488-Amphidinium_carterae.2
MTCAPFELAYDPPLGTAPHCLYLSLLHITNLPTTPHNVHILRKSIHDILHYCHSHGLPLCGKTLDNWSQQLGMRPFKSALQSICCKQFANNLLNIMEEENFVVKNSATAFSWLSGWLQQCIQSQRGLRWLIKGHSCPGTASRTARPKPSSWLPEACSSGKAETHCHQNSQLTTLRRKQSLMGTELRMQLKRKIFTIMSARPQTQTQTLHTSTEFACSSLGARGQTCNTA